VLPIKGIKKEITLEKGAFFNRKRAELGPCTGRKIKKKIMLREKGQRRILRSTRLNKKPPSSGV